MRDTHCRTVRNTNCRSVTSQGPRWVGRMFSKAPIIALTQLDRTTSTYKEIIKRKRLGGKMRRIKAVKGEWKMKEIGT